MKGKIKGFVSPTNCNVLNSREAMSNYAGMFGKYFDHVGNWMSNVNVSDMQNTVLCYCKVQKMNVCSSCSPVEIAFPDTSRATDADPIWEHKFDNAKTPAFMNVEVNKFERRLCNHSMVFSLQTPEYNRVVAEFCPAKKILLTTDWAHDDSKLAFVDSFLTKLVEMGLISVRTTTKRPKPTITLGADPELEYVDQDTHEVLNCGEAGIADKVIMPNGGGQGRIGKDGSGAQREIRPEPSTTPEGLITNISTLIEAAMDEQWSLKGERFSLGGHIHIGGITDSVGFIHLLDHYLAPLAVLNTAARRSSSYGKINNGTGDYRKQPYGLEYRVPPAGWLASKKLAYITLKIVKLAAEKHYSGDDVELTGDLNQDFEALGLTMEETVDFFTEIEGFKTKGLPDDLKKAWGYKVIPKFTLEFRDLWQASVKEYLDKLIKDVATEYEFSGRIVLYGLDTSRGNCFSVVMANMNGIDMPDSYGFMPPLKSGAGVNHVGIPSSIRGSITETKRMKDVILEVIRRTVNPPKAKRKTIKAVVAEVIPENMTIPSSWGYTTSADYTTHGTRIVR